MFLAIPIEDFNMKHIMFGESTPNMIMKNSTFVKLVYSTDTFSMNGLYIECTLHNIELRKTNDENYIKLGLQRCTNYNEILEKIIRIENHILKQYNELFETKNRPIKVLSKDGITELHKTPNSKLSDHFQKRNIKFTNDFKLGKYSSFHLLIKLSGLWISTTEYGLIYKFIPVNKLTL